ncbi:hypothetical protein [uncultured Oscillibacter sp.]|uniref:hypothetical protein n=1 Tax=uncultured Oscillibacter sp. TaxID=876091 RepID=UPI00272D4FBF|nr:hypothetical protein [uncultured Oscillibacter sp.]
MMKRKDRIDRAVETIRGYCGKVKHCDDCRFISEDGNCLFMDDTPPCDWKMDTTRDRQKKEADK